MELGKVKEIHYICIARKFNLKITDMTYNERLESIKRKAAYDFYKRMGKTEEEAIAAGEKEVERFRRLMAEEPKEETWVDLTTGRKFKANY